MFYDIFVKAKKCDFPDVKRVKHDAKKCITLELV